MANWRQIQGRIRRARTSADPAGKLNELFQKTRDAMVAFEAGALEEKSGPKRRSGSLVHDRRATFSPRGLEEEGCGSADAAGRARAGGSCPSATRLRRLSRRGRPENAAAVWRADAGAIDWNSEARIVQGRSGRNSRDRKSFPIANNRVARARGFDRRMRPKSSPASARAAPRTRKARQADATERQRGSRAFPHRPAPGARIQRRVMSNRTRNSSQRLARKKQLRRNPFRAGEGIAPQLRDLFLSRPGRSWNAPRISGRAIQRLLRASRSWNRCLRRLISAPLHRMDEVEDAPAGPGVFLLSDSDLMTNYYVEACKTLRIGASQLARAGRAGRGARTEGKTSLRSQMAEHLEISDTQVTDYLRKHCVVRWLQLDEDAAHVAHFAIALLRPALNIE